MIFIKTVSSIILPELVRRLTALAKNILKVKITEAKVKHYLIK